MNEILNLLKDPHVIAIVVAVPVMLRLLGEMFINLGQVGKQKEVENWLDSAGAFFRKASENIGKALAFLGIGNRQKK